MTGLPADLRAAAALGGEMGQRVLGFDWAKHPLGDPQTWSPAVRAVVANALACRFPIVLWLGEQLRLVYNDAYIPALGDRHPAALGAPGSDVWWDIWDVVGPLMDSVVQTRKATWSDDLKLMLVNNGLRRERYFTFSYSPILGPTGALEGVFCAVTETTERVLSERRLRALNDLGAGLIDIQSVDDALSAVIEVSARHDADLPFVAVYGGDDDQPVARLRHVTPAAAGALPGLLDSLTGDAAAAADGLRRVQGLRARVPALAQQMGPDAPGEALVIPLSEVTGGMAGGALVVGLNLYRPLDDQYRGFCRLIGDQVSSAISNAVAYEAERRRAEALAQLDRAKTVFLTNISHEFRTPLTLMLGPLENAIAAAHGEDLARERLQTAYRNGRRLLRLVNSLLDFSRIEAGQGRPAGAVVDLGTFTAGVASAFAEVCTLGGVELVLDCPPVWAEVDPGMWETVVLNLVSNAFKYTLDGSITVTVGHDDGGDIVMAVTDTGTGIAAEEMPRLFDRFYRPPVPSGRSAEGSGIGLALVRSLVDMHGGTVSAESTAGHGTTMTVRLPAGRLRDPAAGGVSPVGPVGGAASAYADEALQWLAAPAEPQPERSGRRLVLIADDNADMRRHLSLVLSPRWDVITAPDGHGALEMARLHRPDVLVADVMMPGIDGFELIKAIRDDPVISSLPVIILSARAGQEAAGEGLAVGADNYLVKPFSSADLISHVAARIEAAERDRATRENGSTAARRDAAFAELSTALNTAQTLGDALETLLAVPDCTLHAASVAVALPGFSGSQVRISYAGDVRADVADRYHLVDRDVDLPLADVIRTDQRMVVPDVSELGPQHAAVVADSQPDTKAIVIEPLHAADGSVLGALGLSYATPRQFSPADLDTTRAVAAMLSHAVARILVAEREHEVAMSLQERLLDLGGGSRAAAVAATYQPAGQVMRVGGDWYTVTPLGAGRVGISAGDVVGHGLPAAAAMSQLRSALGVAALSAAEPAAVIDMLDRYARTVPDANFATVAYAVVDSAAGTVDYSCAGHPYPLIVGPDGTVDWLRDGRQPALAVRSRTASAAAGRHVLPPGSLLVLYTDGLIERRGEPLDDGFDRLAAAAADCARLPAGAACAALLARMSDGQPYGDDVAIIAVRPVGTTHAIHVDVLPAALAALTPARHRLRAWLSTLQASAQATHDVLAGVGEAVCNAMEHGSDFGARRTVSVEAFASDSAVSVTVADSGRWLTNTAVSRAAHRGRGLKLIHGLSDSVQIARTTLGTQLTMNYHLGRHPGTPHEP